VARLTLKSAFRYADSCEKISSNLWASVALTSKHAPVMSTKVLIPLMFEVMFSGRYRLKTFQTKLTAWNGLSILS
jgi:hypothetical protein